MIYALLAEVDEVSDKFIIINIIMLFVCICVVSIFQKPSSNIYTKLNR